MENPEHTVKISSGNLHYWVYNANKPKIILMIHGFTGDHHGFVKIIPLLKDYRVIVPDLPGFGKSSLQKRSDWDMDSIARLTNEFVMTLKLATPPPIFGHSMGGIVVASMIRQAPALYANKIIMLSPVPNKVTLADKRFVGAKLNELRFAMGHKLPAVGNRIIKSRRFTERLASLLITSKDPNTIQFVYDQMHSDTTRISSLQYYHVIQKEINRHGAIDYANDLRKKDLLIISGDCDIAIPQKYITQLAHHAKANLKIIHGLGHLAPYERAGDIADSIISFIEHNQTQQTVPSTNTALNEQPALAPLSTLQ